MLIGSAAIEFASKPAVAACAPDPSPHSGPTSAAVETCTGINTGVSYTDITSNLTLDLTSATITTGGVLVTNLIGPGNATISISTGAVTATGTFTNGIDAESTIGNINITTNGPVTSSYMSVLALTGGTANVHTTGSITSTGIGTASAIAINAGGGITLVTDGPVTGPDESIYAFSAAGPVSVTINGVANGGVTATAIGHAVTLNINANVSGHIQVGPGGGSLNIGNNSVIKGLVSLIGGTGVITLNNGTGSLIRSDTGLSSDVVAVGAWTGSPSDIGSAVINNAGIIRGRIDFSQILGHIDFNNTSSQSWHTTGLNNFSNGNDTLNNTSTGVIATSGVTTLAFLNGADVFTNAGTLIVGETAGPSSLAITKGNGTLAFNNSGRIVLGSLDGGVSTNHATGNTLTTTAPFISSGASRLVIDADLGTTTQATCTGVSADCIVVGASSGTGTAIEVHDTNASPGGLNFAGMVVVDTASTGTGDFSLAGGAIHKGFFDYRLVLDAPNANWDLVGIPGQAAFDLSRVVGGMNALWYETENVWNERSGGLRREAQVGVPLEAQGRNASGWSVWGEAFGSRYRRDSKASLTVMGSRFDYNIDSDQEMGGLQVGADVLVRDDDGGNWILGGLAGYETSRMKFKADASRANIDAFNLGIYADYLSGPIFADLIVLDDLANVDFTAPSVTVRGTRNGKSIGGSLDAGYHYLDAGSGFFIEPSATLAVADSMLDAVSPPGASFAFNDGTSLRGRLAARVGKDFDAGDGMMFQPFALVGYWHEFESGSSTSITTGATTLTLKDDALKDFGQASVGLSVSVDTGMSFFARADALFGSRIAGGAIRIGGRYSF